jgi:large subunit ribosomal protein L21
MYAIIRTGGHQEKVNPGEQITVDFLNKQAVGDTVKFTALLISTDDGTVVSDHKELAEKGGVTGTVVQHIKADKVDVFQYRNKTGYRRHTGHRQPMTLVEITEIRLGDLVATAPVPTEEPEQPAAEAVSAAAPAKKPAAKKAAVKKPAAKKAAPKSAAKKAPAKKKK